MKFTIITITKDNLKGFKKTAKSVLRQTFLDYEFIIVDGLSSDATPTFAHSLINKFDNTKIQYHYGKDNGIYDAMNKGISYASGDYVIFLNSCDTFVNKNVLSKISKCINNTHDIYYGDYVTNQKINYQTHLVNHFYFFRARGLNHQTIIAARKCFDNNIFNTKFVYCADRDWLIKCLNKGYRYKHINVLISNYDTTGYTSIPENQESVFEDSMDVLAQYYHPIVVPLSVFKRKLFKALGFIH